MSTAETPYVAPRYTGVIASGTATAGLAGIALIWITAYAASPHRPAITAGITAIASVGAVVGALLIAIAVVLRIVVPKLDAIKKAVDDHGHNVLVDHNALHRENIENEERLGLLIAASTRVLAYEEQRAHLREEDHQQIADIREQLSNISLDQGSRIERLEESGKRAEALLDHIARRLAVLTGDNVIDIETMRAASEVRKHLPKHDD